MPSSVSQLAAVDPTLIISDDPWHKAWVIPGLLMLLHGEIANAHTPSGHKNTRNTGPDVDHTAQPNTNLRKLSLAPAACALPCCAVFIHNSSALGTFWLHLILRKPSLFFSSWWQKYAAISTNLSHWGLIVSTFTSRVLRIFLKEKKYWILFHIFYFIQNDSGGFIMFSVFAEISQCFCLFGIYKWMDGWSVGCLSKADISFCFI